MRTKQIELKDYTTMRVGGSAQIVEPKTIIELKDVLSELKRSETPFYILGSGSNTIASDSFSGVVVKPHLTGFNISSDGRVTASSSENWNEIVVKCSSNGLSGIETLASIPGTVGAAPVQNIGAYGQELADVIVSVTVLDIENIERGEFEIEKQNCDFSYRSSIFKKNPGRYVITKIAMQLRPTQYEPSNFLQVPFYKSLQSYLDENSITDYSPSSISTAVAEVRKTRLPDPRVIANSGSFFKNTILSYQVFERLKSNFPDVPNWRMFYRPIPDDCIKVSTGWLLEKAELKGYKSEYFGTYENNALVIVNHNNGNYQQLKEFRDELNQRIIQKFNFGLEQEPVELV
jgi:UDP-N-acetylmuramate dehydrogenase